MVARKKKARKPARPRRTRRVEEVHSVKAALNVHGLSKAGSSLKLEIYARQEKIGEIKLGRGSLFWRGGKRVLWERVSWTRFAEMMDGLAYGT
jgi:hypothetical protein